jgi:hypothetical protein
MPPMRPEHIAAACCTAAIVAELFLATKMAGENCSTMPGDKVYPRAACGPLPKVSEQRDTLVKMDVNSHRDPRGLFDWASDWLYFLPSSK